MKTINLFFDFEFTSLSPDAQPISLGIVSNSFNEGIFLKSFLEGETIADSFKKSTIEEQSFYAEFSDFDINRCDDWVKENVVNKLKFDCPVLNGITTGELSNWTITDAITEVCGDTALIKEYLNKWLSQFKDYQIQFVGDCATFDWYWLLQLIGGWEVKTEQTFNYIETVDGDGNNGYESWYLGLPKLPENISPIPQDLNDLIAYKKGISIREAFELNREELAYSESMFPKEKTRNAKYMSGDKWGDEKHNSLWDAKVIKEIFNKLS